MLSPVKSAHISNWTALLDHVRGRTSPSVIIRRSRDSPTGKDGLAFDKHLLPGRKDCAVRDHEVLSDSGIRDDNKKLISKPHRVQVAKFLRPVVESQLRIMC